MLALLSTHTDSITAKGPLNPTNNQGARLPVYLCARLPACLGVLLRACLS